MITSLEIKAHHAVIMLYFNFSYSIQQTVFYKNSLNTVYQLELILAKMSLIFKVWF